MFNYIGTIVEKKPYNISDKGVDIYYVDVPQLSSVKIEARVLTQAGIATAYLVGDPVVVAELEPYKYIILGKLQMADQQKPAVLSRLATDYVIAYSGTLYKDVILSNQTINEEMTVLQLLATIKELKAEVSELKTQLSDFEYRFPISRQ